MILLLLPCLLCCAVRDRVLRDFMRGRLAIIFCRVCLTHHGGGIHARGYLEQPYNVAVVLCGSQQYFLALSNLAFQIYRPDRNIRRFEIWGYLLKFENK